MGLKSTWWIADEREPLCDLCENDGCSECDPDYEAPVFEYSYQSPFRIAPPPLDTARSAGSNGGAAGAAGG